MSDGIANIRATTKWLIGSFSAVGVLLIAGTQLSSVGKLEVPSVEFFIALAGIGAGLVGVAWALWVAIGLLTSQHLTLAAVASDCSQKYVFLPLVDGDILKEVRAFISANDLFQQEAVSLDDLRTKYIDLAAARKKALEDEYSSRQGCDDDAVQRAVEKVKVADARFQTVNNVVHDILDVGIYMMLSAQFRRSRKYLFLAGLLAAFGSALFAWAANARTDVQSPSPPATKNPSTTLMLVDENGKPYPVSIDENGSAVVKVVLTPAPSKPGPELELKLSLVDHKGKAHEVVVGPNDDIRVTVEQVLDIEGGGIEEIKRLSPNGPIRVAVSAEYRPGAIPHQCETNPLMGQPIQGYDPKLLAQLFFAKGRSDVDGVVCIVQTIDQGGVFLSPVAQAANAELPEVCRSPQTRQGGYAGALEDLAAGIADMFSPNQSSPPGKELLAVGFADSTGNLQTNLAISAARAREVREKLDELLRSRFAAELPTISAIGRGEEGAASLRPDGKPYPFASAASRRVDVRLCT